MDLKPSAAGFRRRSSVRRARSEKNSSERDDEIMNPTTIGLPRGMLYYRYGTLWRTFFTELGADIVVSEPTTHRIAEEGMSITIDEACLSVKVFFGHVNDLLGKCDYIFVPRINSFGRKNSLCWRCR